MTMSEKTVVSIRNLCFGYEHSQEVLHDVSLQIDARAFAVLVGPNGGGKTTLLRLILGLLTPWHGEIKVLGQTPVEACRALGYVPQILQFDRSFPASVLDVVLMGRVDRHRFGWYSRHDRQTAAECLEQVGLASLAGQHFSALSGGERQRVLIAKALASEPEILLLDEPGANLDPDSSEKIYALLQELNRRLTIVLVSHNLNLVEAFASHVVCINRTAEVHRAQDIAAAASAGWMTIRHHPSCPAARSAATVSEHQAGTAGEANHV